MPVLRDVLEQLPVPAFSLELARAPILSDLNPALVTTPKPGVSSMFIEISMDGNRERSMCLSLHRVSEVCSPGARRPACSAAVVE